MSRVATRDLLRVAAVGLRARPLRLVLSALGIALGIGAMVAVVGVAASSRAELNRQLDALGTNMLRASAGQDQSGEVARLPSESAAMARRIGPVQQVATIGTVGTNVFRNDRVPVTNTNGITVFAANLNIPQITGATLARGRWLSTATERFPTVVLGARAAEWLGVDRPGERVWLGDRWFVVLGVLNHAPLAEELDAAALVGWPAAKTELGFDGHPSTIFVRAAERGVRGTLGVLARTANPEHPDQVRVSRPSDALAARAAADRALTSMLLGLGGVGLVVGGIGVANTMTISVMERRGEIGLRRALGARRSDVRRQFLVESLLLSFIGGLCGVLVGAAATLGFAVNQGWSFVLPLWAVGAAVAVTMLVGVIAGLYPAARAARLSPTEALASL